MTAPDCPDPINCPVPSPGEFDLRRLKTRRMDSDTHFFSAYPVKHKDQLFNPGRGDSRFAPLSDGTGGFVPTLCGAMTRTTALLESVFHDVHITGRRQISRAIDLAGWELAELSNREPLHLVDFSEQGLVHLGLVRPDGNAARERLVFTTAAHYPCTRQWSERVHARGHVGRTLPHGIGWHSRIAELAAADAVLLADLFGEATSAAFMLFGDRVRTDRADWDVWYDVADLSAPAADALVLAVAEQLKVTIV